MQTAQEHCFRTAEYARESLNSVSLGDAGYFAGLLHDCGKFKAEFAEYLEDPKGIRGSVNHTFAGFRMIMERYHGTDASREEDLSAELLAMAVGAHHGLFDCIDENNQSGFMHRLTKESFFYEESKENYLNQCVSLAQMDHYFAVAHSQLHEVYGKIQELAGENGEECAFYLGMLFRLLLASVIDGDRRDTAEFMTGSRSSEEIVDMQAFWQTYLERVESKIALFPRDTELNRARGEISDQCRQFGARPGGVYRLNVPTGGGKTLSALRYALSHAQKWGKKRIIFTSPLLSILEQNAAVIREYLDDDTVVLEHHSNVIRAEDGDELDMHELAIENWDAPVIITTMVQLLNTMFEGKTTAIRRFQSLCGSVIVIDEVQTVPPKLLTMFDLAINFLVSICGATVLLCSATQPCLEQTTHPVRPAPTDVIPYDPALWTPFKRTVIEDGGGGNLEEIGAFAMDAMEQVQSLLVICNRKDEAEYLYRALKDQAEVSCHLSASMCTAHRRDVLSRLMIGLQQGRKCLCVATQVIEAGVDISFERVIRLTAGMDSVIQAAGRCNRNGEFDKPVPVYVVTCQGEDLRKLQEIKMAKDASISLLTSFRQTPEMYENDLTSDKAICEYYRRLYASMEENYQDFSIKKKRMTLFDLLAYNVDRCDSNREHTARFCMTQAFKLAGSMFQVFDNENHDLVVPYGKGADLIAELAGRLAPDTAFLMDWNKRAKPYTVSAYDYQLRQLGNAAAEYSGIRVLSPGFYDEDTGLRIGTMQNDFLEV